MYCFWWNTPTYLPTYLPTVTGCVSISAVASLLYVLVGIISSEVGINICSITAGVKKYKSIIKEQKKKYGK